jgi:ribose transport system substrate-binding protein
MQNKLCDDHHGARSRGLRASHLLLIALAVLAVTGCRRSAPTIAVIPKTCGTLLWEPEHTGVEREAKKRGINVYWNAPMREDDIQGQIDLVSRALDRGAKGVIVSPVAALPFRAPAHAMLQKGIPVVVIGTDLGLAPDKRLAYVLNDEHYGGQLAARKIGQLLEGHGAVAIMGISNQLTGTAERVRSLEATLAEEFPLIRVTSRSLALPTVSQEQEAAEKLLAQNVPVDAIVALSQTSTRGAFYALTEFNKTSTVRLVGFDQDLLVPMRMGGLDAVIMQNTQQMGRAAMQLMDEEMHGSASQRYVVLQPQLVTRENLDSAQVREMLDLRWFLP